MDYTIMDYKQKRLVEFLQTSYTHEEIMEYWSQDESHQFAEIPEELSDVKIPFELMANILYGRAKLKAEYAPMQQVVMVKPQCNAQKPEYCRTGAVLRVQRVHNDRGFLYDAMENLIDYENIRPAVQSDTKWDDANRRVGQVLERDIIIYSPHEFRFVRKEMDVFDAWENGKIGAVVFRDDVVDNPNYIKRL